MARRIVPGKPPFVVQPEQQKQEIPADGFSFEEQQQQLLQRLLQLRGQKQQEAQQIQAQGGSSSKIQYNTIQNNFFKNGRIFSLQMISKAISKNENTINWFPRLPCGSLINYYSCHSIRL